MARIARVILVDEINSQVFGPFRTVDEAKVYVVDNKWGEDGWNITDLTSIEAEDPESYEAFLDTLLDAGLDPDDAERKELAHRLADFVIWQVQMGYLAANVVRDSGEAGNGLEVNRDFVSTLVEFYLNGMDDAEPHASTPAQWNRAIEIGVALSSEDLDDEEPPLDNPWDSGYADGPYSSHPNL